MMRVRFPAAPALEAHVSRTGAMPTITKDVLLYHRLQKNSEPDEITLTTGESVTILKEWSTRYLIKTSQGKLFNIPKEFVDPST